MRFSFTVRFLLSKRLKSYVHCFGIFIFRKTQIIFDENNNIDITLCILCYRCCFPCWMHTAKDMFWRTKMVPLEVVMQLLKIPSCLGICLGCTKHNKATVRYVLNCSHWCVGTLLEDFTQRWLCLNIDSVLKKRLIGIIWYICFWIFWLRFMLSDIIYHVSVLVSDKDNIVICKNLNILAPLFDQY